MLLSRIFKKSKQERKFCRPMIIVPQENDFSMLYCLMFFTIFILDLGVICASGLNPRVTRVNPMILIAILLLVGSCFLNSGLIQTRIFCSFHPDEPLCHKFQPYSLLSDFNENKTLVTSTCKDIADSIDLEFRTPDKLKSKLEHKIKLTENHSPCRVDFEQNIKIFFEGVELRTRPSPANFILFEGEEMTQKLLLSK